MCDSLLQMGTDRYGNVTCTSDPKSVDRFQRDDGVRRKICLISSKIVTKRLLCSVSRGSTDRISLIIANTLAMIEP